MTEAVTSHEVNFDKEEPSGPENIVSSEKVKTFADQISDFYQFTPDMRQKGKQVKAILLSSADFAKKRLDFFESLGLIPKDKEGFTETLNTLLTGVNSAERQNKINQGIETFLSKTEEYFYGFYLPLDENSGEIYLNESKLKDEKTLNQVLKHELYHAIFNGPDGRNGFQNKDGDYHELNEAAIQLLNLCENNRDLHFFDLVTKIYQKQIYTPYAGIVTKLAILLLSSHKKEDNTSYDEDNIPQELADYLKTGNAVYMHMNLLRRVSSADKDKTESVRNLFFNTRN